MTERSRGNAARSDFVSVFAQKHTNNARPSKEVNLCPSMQKVNQIEMVRSGLTVREERRESWREEIAVAKRTRALPGTLREREREERKSEIGIE